MRLAQIMEAGERLVDALAAIDGLLVEAMDDGSQHPVDAFTAHRAEALAAVAAWRRLVIRDRSGRFFTGTDPFNNSESDEGFTLEGAEALLAALTKAVADAGGDVHSDAWEVRQAAVLRGPIERLKPVVRTHFLNDKTVEVALIVEGEVVHRQAGRLVAVAAIGDSPEGRLAAVRVDFDGLADAGEQGGTQ